MDVKPVVLDGSKCNGCVNCMKRCPTEAIRVRNGKATIMYERCVGCGECVKVCPTKAKVEMCDSLSSIKNFKYKVALPTPSIYGQFNNLTDKNYVLTALKRIGFDAVYEVAAAAELVSRATVDYIKHEAKAKPVISSACPAVLNLIQMRYEHLIPHLSPIMSPEQLAARLARKEAIAKGYKREEIGIFLISPCAAHVLELKTHDACDVNGVLSIKEVYFPLLAEMNKLTQATVENIGTAGSLGVSWGSSTGEAHGLGFDNYLAADGMENVCAVLNELEHDKLYGLEFLELNACASGCVGGSLNIENPFLARTRIRQLRNSLHTVSSSEEVGNLSRDYKYEPKNIFILDENRVNAMKKAMRIKQIYETLPHMDCGACGAPCCMAFAEDIVRGLKVECKYARSGNDSKTD